MRHHRYLLRLLCTYFTKVPNVVGLFTQNVPKEPHNRTTILFREHTNYLLPCLGYRVEHVSQLLTMTWPTLHALIDGQFYKSKGKMWFGS
jgi:hypothetical protein